MIENKVILFKINNNKYNTINNKNRSRMRR